MHWRDEVIAQIAQLQEQIEYAAKEERRIKETLDTLRSDRDRLRQRLSEPPTGTVVSGQSDPLRVRSHDLSSIIREWERKFNATSPSGFGARSILADRANVTTRTIRRITAQEYEFVTLMIAERILIAMGEEQRLNDGTIKIYNKTTRSHQLVT